MVIQIKASDPCSRGTRNLKLMSPGLSSNSIIRLAISDTVPAAEDACMNERKIEQLSECQDYNQHLQYP